MNLSRPTVAINRDVLLSCLRDFRAVRKTVTLWGGAGVLSRSRMMNEPPPSVFALGPFPIEGAPPINDLVLLPFCPEQGGWHTGVRFEGRWVAHLSTDMELWPTHWLPAPPDPPGFDQ